MAEAKVAKIEKADNRPRITLQDAEQQIGRVIGRLEMLMDIGFSKSAPEKTRERVLLDRRFVKEGLYSSTDTQARSGYLGLAEHILTMVRSEVDDIYYHMVPEEAVIGFREKILSKPPCGEDGELYNTVGMLITPMNILAALEDMCTSYDCHLARMGDRAFDGFLALIEDIHSWLCLFLEDVERHIQEVAA